MDCNSVVSCNGIKLKRKRNLKILKLRPICKFTSYLTCKRLLKSSFLVDVAMGNPISFVILLTYFFKLFFISIIISQYYLNIHHVYL